MATSPSICLKKLWVMLLMVHKSGQHRLVAYEGASPQEAHGLLSQWRRAEGEACLAACEGLYSLYMYIMYSIYIQYICLFFTENLIF